MACSLSCIWVDVGAEAPAAGRLDDEDVAGIHVYFVGAMQFDRRAVNTQDGVASDFAGLTA